jgi:hypothetical protein
MSEKWIYFRSVLQNTLSGTHYLQNEHGSSVYLMYTLFHGSGSSVSMTTGYGVDGPRIKSRWRRDFSHTSRPVLGPTQPPVQWVPSLSRG